MNRRDLATLLTTADVVAKLKGDGITRDASTVSRFATRNDVGAFIGSSGRIRVFTPLDYRYMRDAFATSDLLRTSA